MKQVKKLSPPTNVRSIRKKLGRRDGFLSATDVVLFNLGDVPRAVGFGYNSSHNSAPVITLIEQGLGALEVLEGAIRLNKTLCEDWRLVAILTGRCDVGDTIPRSRYRKVAEILAQSIVTGKRLPISLVLKGEKGIWRKSRQNVLL